MKKLILFAVFVTPLFQHALCQVQKGMTVNGDSSNERFGFSLAMGDSNTFIAGGPLSSANVTNAGEASVYEWNGTAWEQKGESFLGEFNGGYLGYSVSMPNSNLVAIGSPYSDQMGPDYGSAAVYSWNGSIWQQKGQQLFGSVNGERIGISLCMPDSLTLATCRFVNPITGVASGSVQVQEFSGGSWLPKGSLIPGDSLGDFFGFKIDMPSANTIAIGAPYTDGNGSSSGSVRIFDWDGVSWLQRGVDIIGNVALEESGYSISMPDSNTVAIGSPYNGEFGLNCGAVRVYNWDGVSWIQRGQTLYGDADEFESFGCSVSMSSSNYLLVGAVAGIDSDQWMTGKASLYRWEGSSWIQLGTTLYGENNSDQFGFSVSMADNSHFAISAPMNDNFTTNSGQVKVYTYSFAGFDEQGSLISSIFPNPATDIINISSEVEVESITLLDITGKTIKTIHNESKMKVKDITPGIYWVKVRTVSDKISMQKIVINH